MHHHRRKSGHASANPSMTDVRKAAASSDYSSNHSSKYKSSRPAPMTRRSTPQNVQKLGKSPREREKEWEEERLWEDERESFPQFCMTCEKQFIPQDERFLYCSEACRVYDQNNATTTAMFPNLHANYYPSNGSSYPYPSDAHPEPRDIIPRASPSRPSSMHFSPPTTPTSLNHTTAISALRSLSIRPPSPPSPLSTHHSAIWPFTRSPLTSPGTSYSKPTSRVFSSTYDSGGYTAGYAMAPGVDRPLPSRKPGTHSRPKSIELVTPMVGR